MDNRSVGLCTPQSPDTCLTSAYRHRLERVTTRHHELAAMVVTTNTCCVSHRPQHRTSRTDRTRRGAGRCTAALFANIVQRRGPRDLVIGTTPSHRSADDHDSALASASSGWPSSGRATVPRWHPQPSLGSPSAALRCKPVTDRTSTTSCETRRDDAGWIWAGYTDHIATTCRAARRALRKNHDA